MFPDQPRTSDRPESNSHHPVPIRILRQRRLINILLINSPTKKKRLRLEIEIRQSEITLISISMHDPFSSYLRCTCNRLLNHFVRIFKVIQFTLHIRVIRCHASKATMTTHVKDDHLFFTRRFAFQCFFDSHSNRVSRFRSRNDAFCF